MARCFLSMEMKKEQKKRSTAVALRQILTGFTLASLEARQTRNYIPVGGFFFASLVDVNEAYTPLKRTETTVPHFLYAVHLI